MVQHGVLIRRYYHGTTTWPRGWLYHGSTMWYTMVQPYHGILHGFTIKNLLQPTTVSFLDCRNCRPMYSAGMWRRFSVARTRRTAIGENVWLHIWFFIWGRHPTSAQHPPCLAMSVCSKAQTQLTVCQWICLDSDDSYRWVLRLAAIVGIVCRRVAVWGINSAKIHNCHARSQEAHCYQCS